MEFLKQAETSAAPFAHALTEVAGLDAFSEKIIVEMNPRARRLGLRVEPARQCIVLVRPRRVSDRTVIKFVTQHLAWIRKHLGAMPERVPFEHGAVIPYRGTDHVLRHAPEQKGGVWREENTILVTGRPEHMARRTADWLKREAKESLSALAREMAAVIARPVARITVRDTRTRWGSCARGGKLSFSWRLILAPDTVLTYVAAHEVAHLRHANHGAAFKRCVDEILEPYGVEAGLAGEWLRDRKSVV